MVVDNSIPLPCAGDVYNNGECVFITHSIQSASIERWVNKVAKRSGQLVDWHFAGGRAIVLALGDIDMVKASIRKLIGDHDRRYRRACRQYSFSFKFHPPRPEWW